MMAAYQYDFHIGCHIGLLVSHELGGCPPLRDYGPSDARDFANVRAWPMNYTPTLLQPGASVHLCLNSYGPSGAPKSFG